MRTQGSLFVEDRCVTIAYALAITNRRSGKMRSKREFDEMLATCDEGERILHEASSKFDDYIVVPRNDYEVICENSDFLKILHEEGITGFSGYDRALQKFEDRQDCEELVWHCVNATIRLHGDAIDEDSLLAELRTLSLEELYGRLHELQDAQDNEE